MPTPLPHRYSVSLDSTPAARLVRAEGRPPIAVAPPPEWDGPPGVWSPEHLLLAAVAACFTTTFEALARRARLEHAGWRCTAEGILARSADAGTYFTSVTIRPELAVAAADREAAARLLERARAGCFVSASLKSRVDLEPRILVASEPSRRAG